jgi:hypothetical protein
VHLSRGKTYSVEVPRTARVKYGPMVTLHFTSPTLSAMRQHLRTRQDPRATALSMSHAGIQPGDLLPRLSSYCPPSKPSLQFIMLLKGLGAWRVIMLLQSLNISGFRCLTQSGGCRLLSWGDILAYYLQAHLSLHILGRVSQYRGSEIASGFG